jgi:hypothetical protein
MTSLIAIMEILALIGSISEGESDDPNEYSNEFKLSKQIK